MSETPQEIVTRWLDGTEGDTKFRDAIRAVLEDLRLRDIDCGCNNRVTRLEAERNALLSKLAEAGIALADCGTALIAAEAKVERLRNERRELCDERGLLRAAVKRLLKFEASCGEQDISFEDRLFAESVLKAGKP